MTDARRNERLFQFFGAYFHPDWDADGASGWEDLVDKYAADNPTVVEQTARDLQSWLADQTGPSLAELGSEYLPPSGISERDWVGQLAARLSGDC
jgi:hypothetical protein